MQIYFFNGVYLKVLKPQFEVIKKILGIRSHYKKTSLVLRDNENYMPVFRFMDLCVRMITILIIKKNLFLGLHLIKYDLCIKMEKKYLLYILNISIILDQYWLFLIKLRLRNNFA